MTLNELNRQLIAEIERLTEDMHLVDGKGNPARLKGYSQAIPVQPVFDTVPYDMTEENQQEFYDVESLFPYFITRTIGVNYREDDGGNRAYVYVLFAIYDDDTELKGYYTLLTIMERVACRFLKNPVLGPFYNSGEIKMGTQEDDTYPHYFGAMEMIWNLPEIGITQEPHEMEEFI